MLHPLHLFTMHHTRSPGQPASTGSYATSTSSTFVRRQSSRVTCTFAGSRHHKWWSCPSSWGKRRRSGPALWCTAAARSDRTGERGQEATRATDTYKIHATKKTPGVSFWPVWRDGGLELPSWHIILQEIIFRMSTAWSWKRASVVCTK